MAASDEQIRAIIAGDYDRASELIGHRVPVGWPFDAEARDGLALHLSALEHEPRERLWRIRFIVSLATNSVIGSVNFKGPPTPAGDVEIGWGLVPEARGKGYATEASQAVVEWAFQTPEVLRVTATIPEANEKSQRIARRLGMVPTAETKRGLPLWAIAR